MSKALLALKPNADRFKTLNEEYPGDIGLYDIVFIVGSPYAVCEHRNWISPLVRIIRTAYALKNKAIGICFGHQIIGQASGGRVAKSEKGFGIGVISYQMKWCAQDERIINFCA